MSEGAMTANPFTASPSPPAWRRLRERVGTFRSHAFPVFWYLTPRAVLRALPGTSRRFGPPRRCATWDDYRARPGVGWREVFPAQAEHWPLPFFNNDPAAPFAGVSAFRWPAMGVAFIPGGRVLDEHGWVVGEDDTFLGEFCHSGNRRYSVVNQIIKLHPPRRLPGRTLNLCTAYAVGNFFHYMMDGVGRYELVRRAGLGWADFDYILLPRFHSATTTEIDEILGIPKSKIIRVGRREQFACEMLVQPSFPGVLACSPPWLVDFYRALFPARPARRARKIYFPRNAKRRPMNAAALDRKLAALGFEVVDPLRTPDFRQVMAEATHVVGVHGAGLGNLVFCHPGTRVLEIMPSDIAHNHNFRYYYALCCSGGMPYGAVVGKSVRERLLPVSPQSAADFEIDLAELDEGLRALLA